MNIFLFEPWNDSTKLIQLDYSLSISMIVDSGFALMALKSRARNLIVNHYYNYIFMPAYRSRIVKAGLYRKHFSRF